MEAKTVLIVEDEGIEAMDIQQRLQNLGYLVPEIAFSGDEAIAKARAVRPDAVIMDIMLDGPMDGVAAAQRIREILDVPVIYLTAYADENTLQRAKITEPYGYLVKPFKERELHITLDMALYKHKLERRVKESERWLGATLHSIGDAVIATDNHGCIKFMNPIAEDLMGWKLGEIAGRKLTEVFRIINKDTRKPVNNPVTKVLQEGVIVGLANHTILLARDGREVPIDDSAAPIRDEKGDMEGVILVFRDIAEREKAQEELRQAYAKLEERVAERTQDLVAANQQLTEEIRQRNLAEDRLQEKNLELEKALLAKDKFLANMSHELRTPLNAIIGFAGILSMKLPGPLTPEQEKQLQNISISSKHLLSLINDLLDLSKIESEMVKLHPEPASCNSIVRDVAATLQPMAKDKGLILEVQLPEEEVTITTDRRALHQILINFTNNAIKFTEEGKVELKLLKDAGRVEFRVRDTGIGIKAEDQDKLFQAFSQVGNVNSRWHEGSGLGLHLSKKLADLLKGSIVFSSEYGKGSEFCLVLKESEGKPQ